MREKGNIPEPRNFLHKIIDIKIVINLVRYKGSDLECRRANKFIITKRGQKITNVIG